MYYEIKITGSTITCHRDELEATLRRLFDLCESYENCFDFGCREVWATIEALAAAVNRREYTRDLEVALAISLTMIGGEDK